jgi:methylated-DNA-protein-cysteine methyltransferase-like protein
MPRQPFTARVIELIRSIPKGKVATYGGIAAMAGNPRAARQVARILYSCSDMEGLPWHRVVNREGRIVLKTEWNRAEQEERLEREGIVFRGSGRIDLERFLWQPRDTL